jgi:replicative DNA helicase
MTLDQIARYTELAQRKYGAIAAIGIDYLGLIRAPGKSIFEKTAYVAIETKNMAKALRIPVILLSQVNRSSVQGGGDIETHSAKGGGDIEAAADFMLGLQLEKSGDLTLKILKNRNGAAGAKFLVDIDKASLTFKGLTLDNRKNNQAEKTIPF